MFSRSVALGLLASTVSAFDASASNNVAMYWGQGSNQISLKELCNDPSVDIVNLAFVNQFPKKRGEYPATNFANACDDIFYKDDFGNESGLRSSCPTIIQGMQTCRDNGKKVLLSIGGGYPTDYYLKTRDIAEYLADFLWGAFGPPDAQWTGPRPFGNQYVDGFDLDLEAYMTPEPFTGYLSANYEHLVNRWKNVLFPTKAGNFYISGAPQCVVPDVRLSDAISRSHFDFIFVQFYNTPLCNARRAYEGVSASNGVVTTFTFDTWVTWLKQHSTVNPNVKLYLGLPADKGAAPNDQTSYLEPSEANTVLKYYKNKYPSVFGGVMLWEATFNAKNTCNGPTYATNMKAILQGSYLPAICPTPTSSSIASSSSFPTPTAISPGGQCGPENGYGCAESLFGDCCSIYGYCGNSASYCGAAYCNPKFGKCGVSSSSSSSARPTITSSSSSSASSSIRSTSSTIRFTSSSVSSSSSSVKPTSSITLTSSKSISSSVRSSSSSSSAKPTFSVTPTSSSKLTSSSISSSSSSVKPTSSVTPTSSAKSTSASANLSSAVSSTKSSSAVLSTTSSSVVSTSKSSSAVPTSQSSSVVSSSRSSVVSTSASSSVQLTSTAVPSSTRSASISSSSAVSSNAVSSSAISSLSSVASSSSSAVSSSAVSSSAVSTSGVSSSAVSSSAVSSSAVPSNAVSSSTVSSSVVSSTTISSSVVSSSAVSSTVVSSTAVSNSAISSGAVSSSAVSSTVVSSTAVSSSAVSSSAVSSTTCSSSADSSSAVLSPVVSSSAVSTSAISSSVISSSSIPPSTGSASTVTSSASVPTGTGASSISLSTAPSNGSYSAYPTAGSSTSEHSYPVYTGPGYGVPTSKTTEGYAVPTSKTYPVESSQDHSKPSVTSKPGYPASSPAVTKTTTYTTSYVDVCETGLTTITATVTKTYTGVVPKPTSNEIPEGWYTTVTVCKHCGPVTTTVTLTKPYHTPTEAAYGAPSSPADQSAGKDSYPESKLPQAAYVPGIASGEESVSVTSKVYMPVVPAPASEAPAYEATPAPYVPISSTAAYVPSGMASSTIKGAAASTGAHGPSYTPPLFEGAASRFGVGMSGVVGLVAGVLLL